MSISTRLDIDLTFSLAEPRETAATSADNGATSSSAPSGAEQMTGTITASGLDIKIYSSKPELIVQVRSMSRRIGCGGFSGLGGVAAMACGS